MHLIQVLLPIYDNAGRQLAASLHQVVRVELSERFGGLTAYTRAPAVGLWKPSETKTHRDDIVVYEVMTPELDAHWWSNYRQELEARFRQEQVVIRAQAMRLL